MTLSQSELAPSQGIVFAVTGRGGSYDRAEVRSTVLPVSLKAAVTDGDVRIKILTSRIYLKSEGAEKSVPAGVAADAAPERTIAAADIAGAVITTGGPVLQSAIAACNRLSATTRADGERVTMSVPVVWTVTTGRFVFNWRNYDRVGLSEDIVSNPDFYRDQSDFQREAVLPAEVDCRPLQMPVAEKAPPALPAQADAQPEGESATKQTMTLDPKPIKDATPVKTAFADSGGTPLCDGGMVRRAARDGAYLCLCPGNTKRIEKGDEGFACVRPGRR